MGQVSGNPGQKLENLVAFALLFSFLGPASAVQLAGELKRQRDLPGGPSIRRAADWLAALDLGEAP